MAIATYRVADETGSILMIVKLDPSDQFKPGDIVRFQDWYVISLSRFSPLAAPFVGIHTHTHITYTLLYVPL